MTEFYVTFEMAQKMKRLGFDKKVNHAYLKKISIEPELRVGILKEIHSKCPKNYNDNRKGADKGQMFYSAPRLDQAAAWMREVKEIDIEPRVWFVGNKREYRPYVMPPKCKDYIAYPPEDSYEKALESGISMALELLGKEVKE